MRECINAVAEKCEVGTEGVIEKARGEISHAQFRRSLRRKDREHHRQLAESADLGSILHRLVPAIKAVTRVERVYCLALMERVGHFHLWLVPKKGIGNRSDSL